MNKGNSSGGLINFFWNILLCEFPFQINPNDRAPDQNIKPGVVVDHTVVHPEFAEFFLNSHRALQVWLCCHFAIFARHYRVPLARRSIPFCTTIVSWPWLSGRALRSNCVSVIKSSTCRRRCHLRFTLRIDMQSVDASSSSSGCALYFFQLFS